MRYDLDLYMIRSMDSPHMTCCLDVRKTDFPWDDLRAILDEWRAIVPYYQGDLYPLSLIHILGGKTAPVEKTQPPGKRAAHGHVHRHRRAVARADSGGYPED